MANKKEITIAVCIPIWKRHKITKYVLDNYRDLMDIFKTMYYSNPSVLTKTVIIPIIVGSEGEVSKKLAEGMQYVEAPNKPLSDKWNAAFQRAKELDVDACMIAGSDTIINKNYFTKALKELSNNVDYFGVTDAYYLYSNIITHWAGYSNHRKGEPIGDGRMLSKRLLDKLDWQPYNKGLERGLDGSFTKKIKGLNIVKKVQSQKGIMICGLRSRIQITSTDIKAENVIDFKILKQLKKYESEGA